MLVRVLSLLGLSRPAAPPQNHTLPLAGRPRSQPASNPARGPPPPPRPPPKGGRKLELFAREHNLRPGWISVGNQLGAASQLIEEDVRRR